MAAPNHLANTTRISKPRIVLLGYRDAGKSSSGNTILGREEFDDVAKSAQCVKRQGEVAGRHITVVKAPGWWRVLQLKDTPQLTKNEIKLSVSLCPPGPHALLLVTRADISFTETERRSVQEHLELLGERVWSHTIVLFTCGDWLGDTPIEQHIESEGESLQWLVEKCGNRYHVLNNQKRDNHMQVTELMEKIEEMVAVNRGQHYEIDRQRIKELEEKGKRDEERGRERMMKVKKQRESLRSQMAHHLPELKIVLLGYRKSNKSSSGETILGGRKFNPGVRTARCVKRGGEVAGRQITVVEAPGWWRIFPPDQTSKVIREQIELSVSLCPPGPHALLLVIPLGAAFTETERRSVHEHLELLGERVWSHTIVLFTYGGRLGDTPIEQHIESEGESLQWLVEKCGNRYHVFNNQKRDDQMQVTQLMEKIEQMVAENRGQHFEMDRQRIKELEVKKKRDEERGRERMMSARQRDFLRLQIGEDHHLSELKIVFLGNEYAGMRASGNIILGREEFDAIKRTAQCVKTQGEAAGRHVTLVEAPGWKANDTADQTPKLTKDEIELSVSLCPPGPHALLLVICVDMPFTERNKTSVLEHLELLGERVWSHTIVLFTHGDWLGDTPIEQHIESEGESLQWLVEKCGNRYHVLNIQKRDDYVQVTQLMEKIEEMVAENRGQHFEMDIPIKQASTTLWLPPYSQHFIDRHHVALIKRVDNVDSVMDHLVQWRMLSPEVYANIRAHKTNQERMRQLLNQGCIRGSQYGKDWLFEALKIEEPGVIEELENM